MTSQIRYLLDPAYWVREVLGQEPWEKQIAILESVRDHKKTAVKSCHAAGKSHVAASVALWFLYNHPRSIVITTAPTDRQVSGILWKEIRTSHSRAKVKLPGECLTQELRLDHDWYAVGFTAPEYAGDKFQGFHAVDILVIVDESAGVSEDIFAAIDGLLTSDQARLLILGNPTNPTGRFYTEFAGSDAEKISISAFDTPNFTKFGVTEQDIIAGTWREKITGPLPAPYLVTPGWVADRLKQWGSDSPLYRSRVLAQFPVSGADTLIPLHLIEAAVERTLPEGTPVLLGCDIARMGGDESVLMLRQGSRARILKTLSKSDTMETSGAIIQAMRETGASLAKIDAVGVGGGVFDRLNEQGVPVDEMQAGGAAQDRERFANARAEWFWYLRTRFESGDIDIPDDDSLVSQLAGIRYKITSKGQILIESKDEMRRRGVPSPDRADALMLAFAENAVDTIFPRRVLDGCTHTFEGRRHARNEYYAAIAGTPGHDTVSFAIGHVAAGKIIVDVFQHWEAGPDGGLPWEGQGGVFRTIMGLCLHYRTESLTHDGNNLSSVREYFEDLYPDQAPRTAKFQDEIFEGLENRIRRHQILFPADQNLLRELQALERHPGSPSPKRGSGASGAHAVAMLTWKLGTWFEASYEDVEERRSREWPDDNDGVVGDRSGCGLMAGFDHSPGGS